jgi:hypothetical protein
MHSCDQHFGLGRRIFLASGFHSGQHSYSQQHYASNTNPVPRHMRQDRAIHQPDRQDDKARDVDSE